MFFEGTNQNQFLSKFDIIIKGHFNTDTGYKNCNKFIQFTDFCHTFDTINLINVKHDKHYFIKQTKKFSEDDRSYNSAQ